MSIQHRAKLLSCFLLAAALNSAATVSNQPNTVVRGMVVDPTGSVVPNFTVEIRPAASANSTPTHTTASPMLRAQTNREGEFSANLPPGLYEICVARFSKSCRTVIVEEAPKTPEYLRLEIHPSDDHASSELLDSHIRAIAGPGARDCGRVQRKDSPKRATACALRAYKSRKAFYVRYDAKGISDSDVASAMAGDSSGKVYSLGFDSMGMDTDHLPPGATMPDGFHTIIIPCSQPVRLRVTRTGGELICFANDRWLGDQ